MTAAITLALEALKLATQSLGCLARNGSTGYDGDLPSPSSVLVFVEQAINALQAETGEPVAVYIVQTDEIYNGEETYTRHDVCPSLCDAERLFTAPPPAVPQGWKLVPIEPTDRMLELVVPGFYALLLAVAPGAPA